MILRPIVQVRRSDVPLIVIGVPLTIVMVLLWLRVFGGDPVATVYPDILSEERGTEVIMVFIGSSTCGASQVDWVPETLASVQRRLGERSEAAGMAFATVGVALDQNIENGLEFLDQMGRFDEISIGRSWLNQASLRFLLRELPSAETAIPQIVVVAQRIAVEGNVILVEPEQLLARKIGLDEIRHWGEVDFALNLPVMRLQNDT